MPPTREEEREEDAGAPGPPATPPRLDEEDAPRARNGLFTWTVDSPKRSALGEPLPELDIFRGGRVRACAGRAAAGVRALGLVLSKWACQTGGPGWFPCGDTKNGGRGGRGVYVVRGERSEGTEDCPATITV